MTEPTVLLRKSDGAVAIVTLNRPQALNSFTRQMHQELWAALDRVEADKALRAVVLTGAGRGFCAGADLAEFDFAPGPDLVRRADPGPIIEQAFNPTTRRLMALKVPTVAAINGVAAGAGASIAMACDMAIAAPSASFIQAFSKIGLVPDAGGTWFLIKKLGLARAMGCAMLGDKLSAKDAKEWGMIWDVAPEGQDCVEAAMKLAPSPGRACPPRPWCRRASCCAPLHPTTWTASWTWSATPSRRWAARTTTSKASWRSCKSAPRNSKANDDELQH
jgi:2-(1,2-epoxy-1,2-dihydrophenyl)acetyl-CoA isomerase